MGSCPQGMKEVRAGSVSYTAYFYPYGPETCRPQCKPGWRKKIYVPDYVRRMTTTGPCPYQKCTNNQPVTRRVTQRVRAFCISNAVGRDAFVNVAVKPSTGIRWAKPNLMSRLTQNRANTIPLKEPFFVNVNHSVSPFSPVRGIPVPDAVSYCRAVYGSGAGLPSAAQWEHAYAKGKIRSYTGYMELLSTTTRTIRGVMNLLISKPANSGVSWAMDPQTMNAGTTFRCVVPKP